MPGVKQAAFFSTIASVGLMLLMTSAAAAGIGGAPGGNGQRLFEFGLLGSGALTKSCDAESGSCSSTLDALINGNVIGRRATFTDSMTWSLDSEIISGDQSCFVAAGDGTIVTRRKGQINFLFHGLLCGNSETFMPSSLNAAYIVTGGTERFANSVGSGNFTQSNFIINDGNVQDSAMRSTVISGPAGIVRFDGTLTVQRFRSGNR
jgi:hypothetical protein